MMMIILLLLLLPFVTHPQSPPPARAPNSESLPPRNPPSAPVMGVRMREYACAYACAGRPRGEQGASACAHARRWNWPARCRWFANTCCWLVGWLVSMRKRHDTRRVRGGRRSEAGRQPSAAHQIGKRLTGVAVAPAPVMVPAAHAKGAERNLASTARVQSPVRHATVRTHTVECTYIHAPHVAPCDGLAAVRPDATEVFDFGLVAKRLDRPFNTQNSTGASN